MLSPGRLALLPALLDAYSSIAPKLGRGRGHADRDVRGSTSCTAEGTPQLPVLRMRLCRVRTELYPIGAVGVGGTRSAPAVGGRVTRLSRLGLRPGFRPPARDPNEPPLPVKCGVFGGPGVAGVCDGNDGETGDAHAVDVVDELVLLWKDEAPKESCRPLGFPRFS